MRVKSDLGLIDPLQNNRVKPHYLELIFALLQPGHWALAMYYVEGGQEALASLFSVVNT